MLWACLRRESHCEGAGGVPTPVAEVVTQPCRGDMVAQVPAPSRKGKEKIGDPGVSEEVPIFDATCRRPPRILLATLTQVAVGESALLRVPLSVPLVL